MRPIDLKRRGLVLAAFSGATGAALWPARTAQATSDARVVRFGQSASLTGGQATYGKDVQTGIAAAFAAASASDAAAGVRYELQTLDDGGVRSNCLKNALALVDS